MKIDSTYTKIRDSGICFAVVKNQIRLISNYSYEYFIVAISKDVNKFNFSYCKTFPDCAEYTLSDIEIKQFKQDENKLFNKVIHNKYGRVFELKKRSFKAYRESLLEPFISDLEEIKKLKL